MPLTDIAIRQAKPADKTYNLSDGAGLNVSIRPSGKKVWICRFYIKGKAGLFTIGEYPGIKLSDARIKREEIKAQAKQGINPNDTKRINRLKDEAIRNNTFQRIAEDWYSERIDGKKSPNYQKGIRRGLDKDILPQIGKFPITEITSAHIYQVIKKVEARGAPVQANNIKQYIGTVFRFAASTARIDAQYDPTALLAGAIPRPPIKHARALPPEEIRSMLSSLRDYNGQRHIKIGIELLLLMFCRTVELRRAEWCEIDWNKREWHIPKNKMKSKRPHIVPLSEQVMLLLKELQGITGSNIRLVPSMTNPTKAISPTTFNAAFSYMGENISCHAFRATAHTHLAGAGFPDKVIERQLAHVEKNQTTRAYNHQEYLPDRHRMMQQWANYIDELRE